MSQVVTRSYQNLIGGAWVGSEAGATYATKNPADRRETVGLFPESTAEDARRAVDAAAAALPAWGRASPAQRAAVLYRAADLLEARAQELGELLTREEGKTLAEATSEVKRSAANFRFYAGQAPLITGQTFPAEEAGLLLYTRREPVGVVAAITPWNFPISIPARKIAPALAAGCTILFKPASNTPLIAVKLVEALVDAGVPPGVINLVIGPARTVGHVFVTHPAVKAVSFTGSTAAGVQIHRQVALGVRTQMELGGKNPLVVLADADLDQAAQTAAQGAFGQCGQACTATSRVLVERPVAARFVDKLLARVAQITVGNGLQPGVRMGPLASAAQEETILDYIRVGQAEGATLALGGRKLTGGDYDHGYFVEPTVFTDVTPQMRIAREEIFGPILSVLTVDSFDEAVSVANDSEYGLVAGICTRDLGRAQQFVEQAEAGVLKVNRGTTGNALNAPFGGLKLSSTDSIKEQGTVALDFFTRTKTVYVGQV
jgi:alpha-ketoglutaric semialdehyde dehydrogenase